MLDLQLKNQLKELFKDLSNDLVLEVSDQEHGKAQELLSMLGDVVESSPKLSLSKSSTLPALHFHIQRNGAPTGVQFFGIPGGHEFSSLILALLNADGKGKLPDSGIQARIRALKGPIQLRTFISLSCENCPDVVQALNVFALLNTEFEHTMIDGEFAQDEINKHNIQGVPSVMNGDELLSSGKTTLIALLEKLEQRFGAEQGAQGDLDLGNFDVAIVGGGPAGASSAIYSARKGLKTIVLAEKIGGQVQDTKGIENLISVPYTEGPALAAGLHKHMQEYPIELLEHRRVQSVENLESGQKLVHLTSGEKLTTRSLIITTGAKWRELNVPGEKDYIGRGVAFCPHCDGPYYKGKKIAVIGGGNSGVEAAIDLSGIVEHITLIEFGESLKADQVLQDKLRSLENISIITNAQTKEVLGNGEKVTGLSYLDRTSSEEKKIDLDGVFVQIGLVPNSQFLQGMVEMNRLGEIIVDEKGRTSAKGIYAAGDVTTTPFKQIIIAMGEGAKAALAAFEDTMIKIS
jgi:NADH-dependent peroxiredoxin subunit F